MNTCSGLTSDATSVATRRRARCSWASRPTCASRSSGSSSRACASSSRWRTRPVRSRPDVTRQSGSPIASDEQAVRPRHEPAPPVGRHPVAEARAGEAGLPEVREQLAEGGALLRGDDGLARVPAEHVLGREARRTRRGLVEQQDAPLAVEDADERLRRVDQDAGEQVERKGRRRLLRLLHRPPRLPPRPSRTSGRGRRRPPVVHELVLPLRPAAARGAASTARRSRPGRRPSRARRPPPR